MGLSDKPGDDRYRYTLASRVDDLEQLYQHLVAQHGLPERGLTLAVHDWGGMIGLAWAVRHPERVARLVITNTAGFPNPKGTRLPAALKLGRDSALGALLIRGFNAFAGGATRLATVKPLPAPVRRAYTAPYDSWAHRIATLRFVQDIPLGPGDPAWPIVEDTGRQLHRLDGKPILLAWGLQDFVFDRAFYDEFVRRFPQAQRLAFEDAGHYVLEDAHERIVPKVREFLAAHPVAG
jgi:haloalkane dehalogenase